MPRHVQVGEDGKIPLADIPNTVVKNNTDTFTGTAKIEQMISLTQAEYDAIVTKNANTFYVIVV